ncbi:MAG: OmpA family protein [Verrucomicrobiales bacterium]|jgi:outer membrane protein OmpA-like peptidoglycan-associated protein|nr:OmpA family protein [Verrucomicrobiales bacterium]MDB2347650.1 OmpA family protein [Verrucomicrobiales bacterium]MDF1787810.1 OmpA family protein [Verrucomicrobiales bacterium]
MFNLNSISAQLASAALLSLALVSCQTVDPYTGEQKLSKTASGAGIGAALGAGLGAVIGNNTGDGNAGQGALIGAALGAGLGGGIGNYMDRQEAAIRAELEGTGVSVTRNGNNIILNMPHDITFDVADDRLRSDFGRTLNSVAIVLRKFDKTLINVDGHTDSDGGADYNQALSERRAASVARFIESRGVNGQRLIVRGYGESRPIASNNSSAGKAQNRRVELHIAPR